MEYVGTVTDYDENCRSTFAGCNNIPACRIAAIAVAALILAGLVFAVLLILVAIELHQDTVLNDIAIRENKENEKQ